MYKDFSLGGKLLDIDLSTQEIGHEPTRNYTDRFMGGMGINLWKINKGLNPRVSPFDPENIIAFGAGALVGTIAPGASRVCINSKNVFTGGLGSANAGGFFSSELKYAGFDNVFVKGKAKKLVYLFIDDDKVSIEDASFLRGQTTWETENLLRDKIGDKSVEMLSIGPAGENMVPSACIIVSRSRSASRCGLGAIMGSKNLKAIVVRGTGNIRVADPEAFMEACLEMTEKIKRSEVAKNLGIYGTPISFQAWNDLSALPTKNFQLTQMEPETAKNLYGANLKNDHIVKGFGCYSCPMPCSQFQKITKGPYTGTEGEKIECQNLWDFGTKLGIDNLPGVLKASSVCGQLGLDIDNATGAISWAFECFQRGILTEKETDGIRLEWGNEEVILTLLKKIAHKEGFGALLAKGSQEASKVIGKGSEKFSIHIKGQELAEELRAFKGWALGVSVAARGGAHTMGAPLTERMQISEDYSQELFGVRTAAIPDTYEGKAKLVAYYERLCAALEGLGECFFTSTWIGPDLLRPKDFATLYSLATGKNFSENDLMMMGEKFHNMGKIFNMRHAGFTREDDYPPERLLNEPTTGTVQGIHLERAKYDEMLSEYYDLHGWDRESGLPKRETLIKLGLDELID